MVGFKFEVILACTHTHAHTCIHTCVYTYISLTNMSNTTPEYMCMYIHIHTCVHTHTSKDESKHASVVEVKTSAPLATTDKKTQMKPEMHMNIEFDSLGLP